ncbi:PH domain-containing protein [Modestobacter muralis]|uniref:PH domain-containing protein n=1 Tax=Modestobacter muralis TaxID=1608614 RepID=A0A6P0HD47_9ACTN|nr:PH domain-containing protein [Modestobacter muralis]NEK96515.1 PH domain-containing protein [Modestobacter muralis]NEN53415.1 PH domain-containing protein [Modestobacter muralis]
MSARQAPQPANSSTVTAVPRLVRMVVAAVALAIVVVTAVIVLRLPSSSVGVVAFGPVDQVAMFGLGLLVAAAVLWLGRPRVDANEHGIRVRNIATGQELSWFEVAAVRFEEKSSWATLSLRNGDELSVVALQAWDGQRTLTAVRGLRSLLAAHQAANVKPREDLLYPPD